MCESVSGRGMWKSKHLRPRSWWRSNALSYEEKEFFAPWKYNGTAPWFISMHHKPFQAPPPLPPALRFAFAVPRVLFERCTDGRFQLYSQLAVGFHVRAAFSAHRHSNRPLPSVKGRQGVSKRCSVKANHFLTAVTGKTKEQRWTAKCVWVMHQVARRLQTVPNTVVSSLWCSSLGRNYI